MDISENIYAVINVTAEALGCCIILILIVSLLINGDMRSKKGRLFFGLLMFILPQFVGDGVAWLFDAHPGALARTACVVGNFAALFAPVFTAIFYTLYICECVGRKTKASSAALVTAVLLAAAYMVLIIANLFNGMIYSISAANVFSFGPYYILAVVYVIAIFTLEVFLVMCHRRTLGAKNALVISSYAYIPLIASIAHLSGSEIMFLNMGVTLALIIVYTGYQAQERQRAQFELQEAKISTMLSQIQPHFLYNTLNTIGDLCVTDPAQAQETVFEFSDYLRINMDSLSMPNLIPFEKERRHVETYLSLEKKRFEGRLRVICDIQVSDFSLPPLTIQPIAENAVLHGITVRQEPGTLLIRTEETARGVKITVADDGVGFDPGLPPPEDGKSHVGIENVRKRLETVCGGRLTVESTPGKGTAVTMLIPQRRELP